MIVHSRHSFKLIMQNNALSRLGYRSFQCSNSVLNTFVELFVRHGWIAGCQPYITRDLVTESAGSIALFVCTASINGTNFPVCVKHLSAGLIAARTHVPMKRAGGTICSAYGKSQGFTLFLFADLISINIIPVLHQFRWMLNQFRRFFYTHPFVR